MIVLSIIIVYLVVGAVLGRNQYAMANHQIASGAKVVHKSNCDVEIYPTRNYACDMNCSRRTSSHSLRTASMFSPVIWPAFVYYNFMTSKQIQLPDYQKIAEIENDLDADHSEL